MRCVLAIITSAVASTLGGCCGYGGPGCGTPGILGLCGDQVGSETRATVVYFDDTGEHPSDFGAIKAAPTDTLIAQHGDELGEIVLVGRAPGPATLSVSDVPGWGDEVFVWSVRVAPELDQTTCEDEPEILLPVEPAE